MCSYLFFHLPACMLSPFSHVWFFVIPWTVALQAPLSMGFSRQEFGGVFVPSSRESSQPRDWTQVSYISCTGRQVFTISDTWQAPLSFTVVLSFAHLISYSRELSILTVFKDPTWASLVAQLVKSPPAVQETPVWFLGHHVLWRKGRLPTPVFLGFPDDSDGKEPTCNAGDLGSIPGLERFPGGGNSSPLQCSCQENPHGQRSLAGYSPWGRRQLDTTDDWATKAQHTEIQHMYIFLIGGSCFTKLC